MFLVFLCRDEMGPQLGRCVWRSYFPFWAGGWMWLGRVGPHSRRSPFPERGSRSDRAEGSFLSLLRVHWVTSQQRAFGVRSRLLGRVGWQASSGQCRGSEEEDSSQLECLGSLGTAPGWDRARPPAEPSK